MSEFLSQDEVDALLKGVGGDQDEDKPEVDASEIRPYNLATQERIVRGRMPTLEIINERFARLIRIELFNFLRRSTEVSVGPVRITKYSDFIRNLAVPTNLNLLKVDPFRGNALFVMDPTLVFLVIDNMFGGDGRFHTRVEGREFSDTEQRIIQNILGIMLDTYTKSWEPVHPVKFEYLRSEVNTQFVNIATPNEVVVAVTYNIELGSNGGEVHFCMPYAMIEPIRDKLSSPLQGETLGVDKRWVKLMTQQIQSAEVELVASLGYANMHMQDVVEMKVGDVIPLSISETVETKISNVPVMECRYGVFNGQYALRVERLLRSNSMEYVKGEPYGE